MANMHYLKYKIFKPFKSWKNKYLKAVTKKDALQSGLFELTVKEIAEYTSESPEVVRQKHKSGPEGENNFEAFKSQGNLRRDQVEEFYRRCNYYVYELPLWNAERNRPKYLAIICLPYLRRNGYQQVLDFGGGSGDLSVELSKHDLKVSYCDIGEHLFNFAKWRFEKRKLLVKMIKGINNLSKETYDCIFSFDAFEHILGLPEVIRELSSHIKPGGSLIFSGAFSGGTLHLEENEQYDNFANLDKLMRSSGLTFQDRFAQHYFYKKERSSC